ncbi:MAG: hypothetical protein LW860_10425 [Xanthomonadaceae bacterium]|jgi:hypothetical protein|nr:hypothetical protein [Xanthomonadaceae bacterium]
MRAPKIAVLTALLAAALAPLAARAEPFETAPAGVLELLGVLPAPTYDPFTSPILRRRPGHPAERPPEYKEQNPDAIDPAPVDQVGEFIPMPDRWRIMEALGFKFPWYDPYNQNIWKGDKPIHGEDWFLSLVGIADTIIEPRSTPFPTGITSSENPGQNDIFSGVDQTIFAQTFLAGLIYYKGDTTFKPPEWEYRLTLGFQYNRVDVQDVRVLNVDPRLGDTRDDGFVGLQELFVDRHLRDVSDRYDFDAIRFGVQPFSTDFRGFLFQDLQFGVRLFGNRDNNRWQYNLAWFRRMEKDLNSGLNDPTEPLRDDDVIVANLYRQDWPVLGYTSQATVVWNRNREDEFFFDSNGFIQRPASLGFEGLREYDAYYIGYNGDGHWKTLNFTVSGYYLFGDNINTFTGRETDLDAGFFAAEVSKDYDWIRLRAQLAYSSGDDDPFDDKSQGFDAIFENPIFAGADTSYWIRQNIPLVGGGLVTLSQRNGMIPNLRPSKEQGQSNFENPGLKLIGIGGDFDITALHRVSFNLNELWFDDTTTLEVARNQSPIDDRIGTDASVAWIWRPFMTQNIVLRLSGAALFPGDGIKDLYGSDEDIYYSVLGNFTFTY